MIGNIIVGLVIVVALVYLFKRGKKMVGSKGSCGGSCCGGCGGGSDDLKKNSSQK